VKRGRRQGGEGAPVGVGDDGRRRPLYRCSCRRPPQRSGPTAVAQRLRRTAVRCRRAHTLDPAVGGGLTRGPRQLDVLPL
jgi:hypothetical protein